MLQNVHWLVANCVCLLFDSGQVAYSGVFFLLTRFSLLPVVAKNSSKHF